MSNTPPSSQGGGQSFAVWGGAFGIMAVVLLAVGESPQWGEVAQALAVSIAVGVIGYQLALNATNQSSALSDIDSLFGTSLSSLSSSGGFFSGQK
jgi:uncharacterized membrane protein YebE (DUF533 family)